MEQTQTAQPNPLSTPRLALAGGVIGFALGGFFDGILLHQVLQWHHLFSLVPGDIWRDIRSQILMDGLFHVMHYMIALGGLWLLWRSRAGLASPGADRRLLGAALLGFGVWQVVDIVGFHGLLGIHRIRVGVDNPLAYDLGWLAAFGLTALAAGWWVLGGRGGGTGPGRPSVAAVLGAAVLLAGPVAALPAPGNTATLVLFRPGANVSAAVASIGAQVVWSDASGELVALDRAAAPRAWRLLARGAVLVGSSAALGGCLAASRI